MRIETLAVHAGHAVRSHDRCDLGRPFIFRPRSSARRTGGYVAGHVYTRIFEPNRNSLEVSLARAGRWSGGNSRTRAVPRRRWRSFRRSGPAIMFVAPHDAYFGTLRLLREIFGHVGPRSRRRRYDRPGRPCSQPFARTQRSYGLRRRRTPLVNIVDIAPCLGDCALGRSTVRRRQHVVHARAAATTRSRCRRRDALDHEIPWRPQ